MVNLLNVEEGYWVLTWLGPRKIHYIDINYGGAMVGGPPLAFISFSRKNKSKRCYTILGKTSNPLLDIKMILTKSRNFQDFGERGNDIPT